jgi:hypothetical protein
MGSTYSTRNRYEKQGSGENESTWGDILNTVIDLMDEGDDGYVEIDVSAGDVTLTTNNGSADQARNRVLRIIGNPGTTRTVTIPDLEKNYMIEVAISGTDNVKITNTSDANGVDVSAGSNNLIVICDGTSTRTLIQPTTAVSALDPSSNLSDVADVSVSRVNLGVGTSATANAVANVSAVFNIVYPVGTIYTNYDDGTNPGTLLGFGTWVSVATGRVIVGAGSVTDANASTASFTATSTGGALTNAITSAMVPEFTVVKHNDVTEAYEQSGFNTGAGTPQAGMKDSTTSDDDRLIVNPGGGSTNLDIQQPYLVAHIWRRSV